MSQSAAWIIVLVAVFRITSKWMYLHPQKVPSTSKFWDKDVSKCLEFPELRPKYER